MSGGGFSNSATMPQGMGYQPQSQNPQFRGAMNYGGQRAAQMPMFRQGQPGAYGASGSFQWPSMPAGGPAPNSSGETYLPVPNMRDPSTWRGTPQPQSYGSPASVFGKGSGAPMLQDANAQQYQTRPMQQDQAIGSPPSAFGFGPSAGYVGQTMSPPAQSQPMNNQGQPLMNAGLLAQLFGNRY
jgi:hypothetical protein